MTKENFTVHTSLDDALRAIAGTRQEVAQVSSVSGGDINRAYRLTLKDGTHLFMKSNTKANLPFFTAERTGLTVIADSGTIRTPRVLGIGTDDHYGSFLILEWAESKPVVRKYWENFGYALSAMHAADTTSIMGGPAFGFPQDNFIGAGRQVNTPGSRS